MTGAAGEAERQDPSGGPGSRGKTPNREKSEQKHAVTLNMCGSHVVNEFMNTPEMKPLGRPAVGEAGCSTELSWSLESFQTIRGI